MKKNLISLTDLTQQEVFSLLEITQAVKKDRSKHALFLNGKTIGLIFQKPSNRTRVSFEVGIHQMGGNCLYLGPEEINLGVRESTVDVAKTLSRYLDAIVARTFSHKDLTDLAKYASIPVINGLSDLYHPCQALADIFSIKERFGTFEGLTLAYIGDGNNVCHSLMLASGLVGLNMNIAVPKGYEPNKSILKSAKALAKNSKAKIRVTHSPKAAVKGSQVIYTDVWVSMGQESESVKRLNDLQNYQINGKLAKTAAKDYIFMHCLPAHRGQEVTDEVIDGPHSIVFDQAENRMHVQKAILISLIGM